jgi:ribosome biogenesis SPOUT family RNA methylase Rps3
MQMTTDTAVRTCSLILLQGRAFDSIPFVDRPEFLVDGEQERLVMDFRYVKDEITGEPLICPEVLELLKADFNFDYGGLE